MDKLVLGVVLPAAALPVAVGLVNGLWLLLALVLVQIFAQVQDSCGVVLMATTSGRENNRFILTG